MSRKKFCNYMKINRSTLYYTPKGESNENLDIMRRIDEFYLEHPTSGVKTMVGMLDMAGIHVNEKRVRRLMRKMGLQAIYPKRCLSKGGCAEYRQPYLLRNLEITRPNQVWSTDISYIPTKNGFMYLYAIIDVYSRFIVAYRLSNTLSASNCHILVQEAVARHGIPEIINSDQGSQYTTPQWAELLDSYNIKISMDGKGRCKDNIWIERFWRTIKQEYVYITPAENVTELQLGTKEYIEYYNFRRPHQSLGDDLTPATRFGFLKAAA